MNDYEYTGGDVPVKTNDVIQSVLHILDEYDDNIKNGTVPDTNPFTEQIVLPNNNGKYFEVPEEIQRRSIQIWLSNKKESGDTDQGNTEGFENENNTLSTLMKYIIGLILLVVIIWMSMKYMY
jgi:hypothetical protein